MQEVSQDDKQSVLKCSQCERIFVYKVNFCSYCGAVSSEPSYPLPTNVQQPDPDLLHNPETDLLLNPEPGPVPNRNSDLLPNSDPTNPKPNGFLIGFVLLAVLLLVGVGVGIYRIAGQFKSTDISKPVVSTLKTQPSTVPVVAAKEPKENYPDPGTPKKSPNPPPQNELSNGKVNNQGPPPQEYAPVLLAKKEIVVEDAHNTESSLPADELQAATAADVTSNAELVLTKPPVEFESTLNKPMYVKPISVNVRDYPASENTNILTSFIQGAEIKVISKVKGKDWYRVQVANFEEAYIHTSLLADTKPEKQVSMANETRTMKYLQQDIRVRKTPFETGEELALVKSGDSVLVTGIVYGGEWARVSVPGGSRVAYIKSEFLTDTSPPHYSSMVAGYVDKVIDTATLVIDNNEVKLYGISKGEAYPHSRDMSNLIRNQGNYLNCRHVSSGLYKCSFKDGNDLSALVLLNGGAKASKNSDNKYFVNESIARNEKRGIWASY